MITENYKYILNTSGFTLELPPMLRLRQDKSHCAVTIQYKAVGKTVEIENRTNMVFR